MIGCKRASEPADQGKSNQGAGGEKAVHKKAKSDTRRKSFWDLVKGGPGNKEDLPNIDKAKAYISGALRRMALLYSGQGDPERTFTMETREGNCVVVLGKGGKPKDTWDSLPIYRVFWVLFSLSASHRTDLKKVLKGGEMSGQLYSALIDLSKQGDIHVRHDCPMGSKATARCVRATHVRLTELTVKADQRGNAVENEMDKHYHHFLHDKNPTLAAAAVAAFGPGGSLEGFYTRDYGHPFVPLGEELDTFAAWLNKVYGLN
jgi:hypothetical protein